MIFPSPARPRLLAPWWLSVPSARSRDSAVLNNRDVDGALGPNRAERGREGGKKDAVAGDPDTRPMVHVQEEADHLVDARCAEGTVARRRRSDRDVSDSNLCTGRELTRAPSPRPRPGASAADAGAARCLALGAVLTTWLTQLSLAMSRRPA